MRHYILFLICSVILTSYSSGQILDQYNTSTYNSGWIVNSGAYEGTGQSFTAGLTGNLETVVISIDTPSVTYPVISGTFRLSVYQGNGFAGSLLATEDFIITTGLPYGDFQVLLTNDVDVIAGNQYTFRVEEISGTGQIQLNATANNYTGGNLFNTVLSTTTAFTGYDLLFKTFVSANSYSTIDVTECNSYVSPSGVYEWHDSGTYMDTIPNSTGGDSVITVNLSIIDVDVSVTNNDPVLTANLSGAVYQWLDCKNGMASIAGATNQSYTATGGGEFAVMITADGCVDTSECFSLSTVSLPETLNRSEIQAYPNPTTGKINLSVHNSIIKSVRLMDMTGKQILVIQPAGSAFLTISIEEYPTGIYWLEVVNEQNTKQVFKIVKR